MKHMTWEYDHLVVYIAKNFREQDKLTAERLLAPAACWSQGASFKNKSPLCEA